ncbi:MAG: hypothetical protein ACREN2_01515 [Candidatus Dormibacteria bacterium]
MEPEAYLIDTGGPDDNVPLETLATDEDPRFRPSAPLIASMNASGGGSLDRPVLPLLNALQARGVETLESCAGGMLFVSGVDRRAVAAVRLIKPTWAQMRWTVWAEAGETQRSARTELWWSRRMPNWGGYLGTEADWRWRRPPRRRGEVDRWLTNAARRVEAADLPEADRPTPQGAWLDGLVSALVDRGAMGEGEWFEVVLCRDPLGWSAVARREYHPTGSLEARTLRELRRAVNAQPDRLVAADGSAGYAELRAALAAVTGGRRWSQLDDDERRAMIAVYSIPPSEHAANLSGSDPRDRQRRQTLDRATEVAEKP